MNTTKLILLVSMVLVCTASAFALSLAEAKSSGLVGEQANGYLGIVSSPSPEVQNLVDEINGRRKAKYLEIASKNGTSIAAVESLAGKKAIDETSKGQWVQLASGQWGKK